MIITPYAYLVVVTGVGQAVVTSLQDTPESGGVPTAMRLCLAVPGAIAADSCQCGQFAQTIVRIQPTLVFPSDASNNTIQGGCGDRSMMAIVQATIFRCIPGVKSNGDPPTCEELFQAELIQAGDEFAMRRGIECRLAEMKRARPQQIIDYRVTGTDFLGPDGNCAGISINYSFQLV